MAAEKVLLYRIKDLATNNYEYFYLALQGYDRPTLVPLDEHNMEYDFYISNTENLTIYGSENGGKKSNSDTTIYLFYDKQCEHRIESYDLAVRLKNNKSVKIIFVSEGNGTQECIIDYFASINNSISPVTTKSNLLGETIHLFKSIDPTTGQVDIWQYNEDNFWLEPYTDISIGGGNSITSIINVPETFLQIEDDPDANRYIGVSSDLLVINEDNADCMRGIIYNLATNDGILPFILISSEHQNTDVLIFKNLKTNVNLNFSYYNGMNYDTGNNFEGYIFSADEINTLADIENFDEVNTAITEINNNISAINNHFVDIENELDNIDSALSNTVPQSRLIAGYSLTSDIQASSLANAISPYLSTTAIDYGRMDKKFTSIKAKLDAGQIIMFYQKISQQEAGTQGYYTEYILNYYLITGYQDDSRSGDMGAVFIVHYIDFNNFTKKDCRGDLKTGSFFIS